MNSCSTPRGELDLSQGSAPLTPSSVAFLEYALSTLAEVQAPAGAKMEAIALVNVMVMMTVRMGVTTHGNVSAWQAAQVECLSAIVTDGRHPHLAAAVGRRRRRTKRPICSTGRFAMCFMAFWASADASWLGRSSRSR